MENYHIKRILVVDDDESSCLMVQHFLRREGYDCQSTTVSNNVLAMLEKDDFSLVISDIVMPEMNGVDLVRKIRLEHPGVDTIMMTGYTEEYTYSDIIQAGAADFIEKPFRLPELKAKIERVGREQRLLKEIQENQERIIQQNAVLEEAYSQLQSLHQRMEREHHVVEEVLAKDLEESNIALKIIQKHREQDRTELGRSVIYNIRDLVFPHLYRLEHGVLSKAQLSACIQEIKGALENVISPFPRFLSGKGLSPAEIRIAEMIKAGKTNKEITVMLSISDGTVRTHRERIRKKLGLTNQKSNLQTYLHSLQ